MLVFLGLGSNLGHREEALASAASALAEHPGLRLLRRSELYDSAPIGPAQPRFLNAAVEIESGLGALELLSAIKVLETRLGRVPSERWGPRAIDLDILIGDEILSLPGLSVPHPRLAERAFALMPLCDLVPERIHPGLGRTLRELLASLPPQGVQRVASRGPWSRVRCAR